MKENQFQRGKQRVNSIDRAFDSCTGSVYLSRSSRFRIDLLVVSALSDSIDFFACSAFICSTSL